METIEENSLREREEGVFDKELGLAEGENDHILELLLDSVNASDVLEGRVNIVGIDHILHHDRLVLGENQNDCVTLLEISSFRPVRASNFLCHSPYDSFAASTS